jgi:hypothetical protein
VKVRRPLPPAGALARARALVLEAGVELPLPSWDGIAVICDTPWLPVTGRATPAVARVTRRRLRLLAAAPRTVADAAAAPRGELVHVRGQATALADTRRAPLWRVATARGEGGPWLVEEGDDFLLTDPEGGRVAVIAAGGHLVSGAVLRSGDEVSVFGFVDEAPDAFGLGRGARGRGGVAPALRSGSALPLLVSVIRRYAK